MMKNKNALVLMKAMPPTKGHERLLNFAEQFAGAGVVLIDTAPGEPLIKERVQWAELQVVISDFKVKHLELDDQDPSSEGFWERWKGYIDALGTFDFVIGSEPYCAKVAEVIGARFIPYDPGRELVGTRGTDVRNALYTNFKDIASGFQSAVRTTVTVFGAESTGKTTLSRDLAGYLDSEWIFEWARPYLEGTGQTVVDLQAMHEIHYGQWAVEENANMFTEKPFIIRDTDLYSTIGYWEQPHWAKDLGPVPNRLITDAAVHRADLYLITKSNIPFEVDPLRYGGDHRESPDEYWISVAEKYNLPYMVLTDSDRDARLAHAVDYSLGKFFTKNERLAGFDRELVRS